MLFQSVNDRTGSGIGVSVTDITSGRTLWTLPGWWEVIQSGRSLLITGYGAADFGPSQSIAMSGENVYIGEFDPPDSSAVVYAVALDARTGVIRWRYALPAAHNGNNGPIDLHTME
jgi:hypothetical protein